MQNLRRGTREGDGTGPLLPYSAALEDEVSQLLEAGNDDGLRALLVGQHPADVADVIDRLDDDDQMRLFRLLKPDQAADVLAETNVTATRALLRQLSTAESAVLLSRMSIDDVAEILSEDVPERRPALLGSLPPDEAGGIQAMLRYPPRSAGRLMTEAFVRLRPQTTVSELLVVLRRLDPQIESISDMYVLNEERRLLGVVSLRSALAAPLSQPMAAVMREPIVTALPETAQDEVARLVSQYDLLALPVVAENGEMLGIITVDDVIDVLVDESTQDVLQFGGVQRGATDESYFDTPIGRAVRRRVVWLLLLFVTGSITVNVLGLFEETLGEVVALTFFIPLLIGTGGNTGAQTVSTMIRALALGEVRTRDVGQVVSRELLSGLLLGTLLGCCAFVLSLLWGQPAAVGIVVALSVLAICTWANTIGAIVPLVAYKFGLDPALVSAPLITTLVDATGLAIYLLIARAVLGI